MTQSGKDCGGKEGPVGFLLFFLFLLLKSDIKLENNNPIITILIPCFSLRANLSTETYRPHGEECWGSQL